MDSGSTLTYENTSKIYEGEGWKIQYHEAGAGEPVIFLHEYGPGSSAWVNYHKNIGELSKHFRCLMPDVGGTGMTVAPEGTQGGHERYALTALKLMDGLGIEKAHIVGHSSGGTASLLFGYTYPDRVLKVVTGSCHHSRGQSFPGGEPYMIANRPSEGNRATMEVTSNPSKENFRRYLKVHIDDEALVTDELVDYVHDTYMANPSRPQEPPTLLSRRSSQITERRGAPYSHLHQLWDVEAPTLIIYGRYDRMCSYEIGLTILNYVADSRIVVFNNCGHWPPFEKPDEWNSQVINFLKL